MSDELNPNGRAFAEIIALRIALKRVIAQFGFATNQFDDFMKHEHGGALSDLATMEINDADPARGEAIRMHAERVIDEIYTSMRTGDRPKS